MPKIRKLSKIASKISTPENKSRKLMNSKNK